LDPGAVPALALVLGHRRLLVGGGRPQRLAAGGGRRRAAAAPASGGRVLRPGPGDRRGPRVPERGRRHGLQGRDPARRVEPALSRARPPIDIDYTCDQFIDHIRNRLQERERPMFRNYLAAALNNLARHRLFAAISIAGLAIGMAAAILTGLYIRDELTFDHFVPGYRDVYVVNTEFRLPGRPPLQSGSVGAAAPLLKLDFREVKAAARLAWFTQLGVRRGPVEALETGTTVAWADPDLFAVLP